jgi:hypothetical protein
MQNINNDFYSIPVKITNSFGTLGTRYLMFHATDVYERKTQKYMSYVQLKKLWES